MLQYWVLKQIPKKQFLTPTLKPIYVKAKYLEDLEQLLLLRCGILSSTRVKIWRRLFSTVSYV